MTDWIIQSRAHACQSCAKPFADQEPYHTLLFDRRRGLERQDVCESCWAAQFSHGASDRQGFISHWQGIFAVPPPAPPEPIQKDTAESLLRRLIERANPELGPACFILAVMLERKRVFKVKAQSVVDQRRTLVYEHARTGDLFTILDPHLQLTQLEQVQHQVMQLLEQGLAPASAPLESPDPESSADPVADRASGVVADPGDAKAAPTVETVLEVALNPAPPEHPAVSADTPARSA